MALMLNLGGVGECVRLIWEWSVHNQESGDLHWVLKPLCSKIGEWPEFIPSNNGEHAISVREAFELFLGIIEIVKCPTITCTIWMHKIDNLRFVTFSIFLLRGQGWFVLLYWPTTTFHWRWHITFCRCTFCAFCRDVCGNILYVVGFKSYENGSSRDAFGINYVGNK